MNLCQKHCDVSLSRALSVKVVPKSYRPQGQPRSTRNEFPSPAVFENCRLFQCGGLFQSHNLRITSSKAMLINKISTFLFI